MHFKIMTPLVFLVLVLSGCGSKSNLEQQSRLVEYQACLQTEGQLMVNSRFEENQKNAVEIALNFCKKYKP